MTIVVLISCVTDDLMMCNMMLFVVGLLGLAGVGSAQLIQLGQCGTIPLMQNFVLNTFANETWYEVGKASSQNADCSNLQFTANTDGTISVSNPSVVNNFLQASSGVVTQTIAGSAQLTLTLAGISTDFRILGTDYSNYAIAISCVDASPTQRTVNVWQLGRSVNSYDTAASLTAANNLLSTIGLTVGNLLSIDHSANACTQLPVIGDGQAVILSGQCATASIPAVQNFDVALFGGTWHEISSYYSANAVGTCARADYALEGSTVNVVNSQVLNQQLDTITGTATLIGTDGSGRLSVILDVQGVLLVQELLVLGTDYTSYAVSYSCFDLPNNQRQVNSWILSRTKQISAASLPAVNNVIASLVDLNDAYYIATDQSDNGCFYFPTHQSGVPVAFPGQCDDTIAALPNFNLAQFVGTWHEVEAYPKLQQTGTCVNHAFTTGTDANSLNLVSNQVINQAATSGSGNVTIDSTDGSGRLTLTLTFGDQTIQFPYWILTTDYTSYALAYSCENIDDDFRAVFTWKLSRAQILSAAATTAINTAMAAVQVVDQQYFENIDQTDDGCFYFPEPTDGEPVVFSGQCNTSIIDAVPNFDPAQFGGTWHEISSYYSANAVGTCARADYELVGSTVNVVNSQVINQQLDTISGTATLIGTDGSGRLSVILNVQGVPIVQELLVLGTDYTSYAVSYSCFDLPNNQRQVNSWILSRTKQISAESLPAVNNVIASLVDLNDIYYIATDQSDNGCFYFPTHQSGVPVAFPGQCDDTIAALPNFNLAQFVGTWHEVEAYPKLQQTGTCVNHAFTTGTDANSLNLVSNQVINQAATSGSGNVTIDSTDGSGRLTLTLTFGDQTIQFPYWILTTDYTSYALAYSCENIDDDFRAVFTWKLSRAQILSAAATTAINTAMAAVQVVDQQYFENIDQTDDGCFYFPEPTDGEPVVFSGQCNTSIIDAVPNFDPAQFGGTWHEISSYYSANAVGTCARADYELVGSTVNVVNSQVINQQLDTISGTATLIGTDGSGRLSVILNVQGVPIVQELLVLGTDYTSYAVSYSCFDLPNNQRQVNSWILSRTKQISAASLPAVNNVIASLIDLNDIYYIATDQSDNGCFYFPTHQSGVPVAFPGQCDDTIAALPNFNLAQFVGTWHEVEAYPKLQQTGTCVNHAFTAGTAANSLNLVSNQVINQAATSGIGNVTIVSTDGSGRLTLTLTFGGQTIQFPYWILTTDYTSYALAYSCENIDNDYRAVFTWKLSRAQILSAAATTAINTAMAAVQVVDQQYFENIDQTAAGCFYFPEPIDGAPVLFRGQCNNTIAAVPNFNLAQFVGTWHEIEAYPKPEQAGTCINHVFSSSTAATILNLVSNQVINQVLTSGNGSVVIDSTDGTGRLNLTMTTGSQLIGFPYWILATDYNSYALAYSCVSVNEDYSAVYSWKLSRTQTLPAAAATLIDNAIAAVTVLDQQYFENIDQSAAGCFHYREDASEQVILPGQCDTTIPVQANFNVSQFVGTWYQIERYPYPQVSNDGTCVGARYTVNGDSITILNWEVLDGVLNTEEGTASVNGATLTVTLPVEGSSETVTRDLHILSTDYEDFALAYTCVNINALERSVGAFKLSRSRQLSNAGQSTIATFMASREELHQPYFISVSHSDDCEEPSSAFLFKSSIIVMLFCVVVQLVM